MKDLITIGHRGLIESKLRELVARLFAFIKNNNNFNCVMYNIMYINTIKDTMTSF